MRTSADRTLCLAAAAAAVLAVPACGKNAVPPTDAAVAPPDAAVPPPDALAGQDAAPALGWVDFSITGCQTGPTPPTDAGAAAPCAGPAPLTLEFAAVAPSPVDHYKWSFGDGTGDDTSAAPSHRFSQPGDYDVSLSVGGPGGTASVSRTDAVHITAASLGAACDQDAQCQAGSCICSGASCPPALARGLCSASCDASTPCQSGVCTDLAPAATSGGQVWQKSLCLPACGAGQMCPTGLTCQELRRGDNASGWIAACFAPGVLADVGGSCVDATGAPQDDLCAGGLCAAEGARGLCTASCSGPGDCPSGAACATFAGSLGSICLARCQSSSACSSDPWLACVAPGGPGDRGFTVTETPAPGGYCAPKPCTSAADCGTDGVCAADGYCGPQ